MYDHSKSSEGKEDIGSKIGLFKKLAKTETSRKPFEKLVFMACHDVG